MLLVNLPKILSQPVTCWDQQAQAELELMADGKGTTPGALAERYVENASPARAEFPRKC